MQTPQNQPQPAKPTNPAMWIVLVLVILGVAGYGLYAFVTGDTNDNQNTNQVTNSNTAVNTNTTVNTNVNSNQMANSNINSAINANINTSGWKTYLDQDSGLTIKYPSDWMTIESEYMTVGFRPTDLEVGDQQWSAITLVVRSNPKLLSLESFYEQSLEFQNPYVVGLAADTLMYDDVTMTYFETIPGVIAISKIVYKKDASVIEISMGKDQIGRINNLENIFLKIAASVK
ncbi:MAG: hypothetical protein ACD_58C00056G0002 [uncultured bacterium]|nr:MAG: hypothetical protein ACD_58C00056G0002 [uncultured bacterium]